MVLTSDASISIWSFYASEDGLDISKPCVLLMFVLLVMTGFRRMPKSTRLNCSNNVQHKLLTGSIASAHSPCPLWSSLTLSASSVMRTKSPTTNWDEDAVPDKVLVCNAAFRMSAEGDIIVEEVRDRTLSDDSEELVTLVKIAGLKVHLKNECRKRKISMRNVKSNRLILHL